MRLTKHQIQEIEFLSLFDKFTPTQQEREDYINITVLGKKKSGGQGGENRLFQSKRKLDIMIGMWREDLTTGLISVAELTEDDWGQTAYFKKLLASVLKGVMPEYRYRQLLPLLGCKDLICSFTNFNIEL